MADETARLTILVDSTSATVAVKNLDDLTAAGARAERSTKTSAEALALFAKIDPVGTKLGRLDDLEAQLSKLHRTGSVTASDFAAMSEILQTNRAKLLGVGEAVETVAKGFGSNTRLMSEASTIAADIASGQFGRIRRSAAAMLNASGALQSLFTAQGAAALALVGVIAALAYSYERAEAQEEAYNKSILATNNYAGVTVAQMDALAHSMQDGQHTSGDFAAALVQVNSTGRFTGEQLQRITQAALDFGTVTGGSVKEAIKLFEELGDKPVEASLKLNDQFHYLTASVYEQIVALEKQGDHIGAVELAQRSFADFLDSSRSGIDANLGRLAQWWIDIKGYANDAADGMAAAVRVALNDSTQLERYNSALSLEEDKRNELASAKRMGLPSDAIARAQAAFDDAHNRAASMRAAMLGQDAAAKAAAQARQDESAYIDAEHHLDELNQRYDPVVAKQAKLNDLLATYREIQKHDPNDPRLSDGSLETLSADIMDGPEKKGASAKPKIDEEARAYNALNKEIAEHFALLRETDDGQTKLDATQQFAARVLADLDDKSNKLNAADKDRIRASIDKLLALDKETQATVAQKNALEALDKLTERFGKQDAELSARMAESTAQELDLIKRGNTDRSLENTLKQIGILADKQRIELQAQAARDHTLFTKQYLDDLKKIDDAEKKNANDAIQDAAKIKAAQADWHNGVTTALNEIKAQSENVAQSVHDVTMHAFDGAANSIVSFLNTGKAGFRQFAISVLSSIEQIIVRMLLVKALGKFFPGFGDGDGNAAALTASATALATSGAILTAAAAQLKSAAAALANAGASAGAGGGSGGIMGFIGQGLSTIFGGGFANGAAFSGGNVLAFGNGGIVGSPTLFPMATGMGLMGEAGPEAVMPLQRASDGRLGVVASGAGGMGDVNITVVVNNRGDAKTQTNGSHAHDARQIGEAIRVQVVKEMMNQQRQGGLLWKMANGQ